MTSITISISLGSMDGLSGRLGLRTSGGYAAATAIGSTSAGSSSRERRAITNMWGAGGGVTTETGSIRFQNTMGGRWRLNRGWGGKVTFYILGCGGEG